MFGPADSEIGQMKIWITLRVNDNIPFYSHKFSPMSYSQFYMQMQK